MLHRFTNITIALSVLAFKLTLPVADVHSEDEGKINGKPDQQQSPGDWERWLIITQGFIAPQFMSAIIWHQLSADPSKLLLPALISLGGSVVFALVVLLTSNSTKKPRWYPFISIPGFIISVAWISTVADEMVSILKALGVIWNISEAILGLTVFAVGNSLDDLAANVSVAQHRHPVMALSACFGGPLLNILLGISISGLYIFAKSLQMKHQIVEINLHSSQTLFITAGTVIAILVATLSMMLWTRWKMTKLVGIVLIAIWGIGTIVNLVLKIET
jgi:sodium/potassium/calcium exchanger 6